MLATGAALRVARLAIMSLRLGAGIQRSWLSLLPRRL